MSRKKALLAAAIVALCAGMLWAGKEWGASLEQAERAIEKQALTDQIALLEQQVENQKKLVAAANGETERLRSALEQAPHPAENQVIAEKIPPLNGMLLIDGGYQPVPEGTFLLKAEGEEYISTTLIKQLFLKERQSGTVVKGYPTEWDFVYKADGKLDLVPYYDELEVRFQEQLAKGDPTDVFMELDGLTLYWGEVGLREYVIDEPAYLTRRGITIGSTRMDVQQAYGKLGDEHDEFWYTVQGNAEYMQGSQYRFQFEGDKVTEIRYGWVD